MSVVHQLSPSLHQTRMSTTASRPVVCSAELLFRLRRVPCIRVWLSRAEQGFRGLKSSRFQGVHVLWPVQPETHDVTEEDIFISDDEDEGA